MLNKLTVVYRLPECLFFRLQSVICRIYGWVRYQETKGHTNDLQLARPAIKIMRRRRR